MGPLSKSGTGRAILASGGLLLSGLLAGAFVGADARTRVVAQSAPLAPLPPALRALANTGQSVPTAPRLADPVELAAAIRGDPLNPRLVNAFYVSTASGRADENTVEAAAALLARMGWRYSAAQQNIFFRGVIRDDFAVVMDRADALLRRQRLISPMFQLLAGMESVAAARPWVVKKLSMSPPWRSSYLVATGQIANPALASARLSTLRDLKRSCCGGEPQDRLPRREPAHWFTIRVSRRRRSPRIAAPAPFRSTGGSSPAWGSRR